MINWERKRQHIVLKLNSLNLDCEILYENPHESPQLALVCHPHPLHQGTMYNKVVTSLTKGAHQAGLATLRFNFPGVGQSTGTFDDGIGEAKVITALLTLVKESFKAEKICLAGFSFGGAVASFTYEDIDAKILVAPAWRYIEQNIELEQPTLIIHSFDDQIVSIEQTFNYILRESQQNSSKLLTSVLYPDAGHFFEGYLERLKEQTASFLKSSLSSIC